MAEDKSGVPAGTDVRAIRYGKPEIDPEKIIAESEIMTPEIGKRDPMKRINSEIERQGSEAPTTPSANARVTETPTTPPPVKSEEAKPLEKYTKLHGVAIQRKKN